MNRNKNLKCKNKSELINIINDKKWHILTLEHTLAKRNKEISKYAIDIAIEKELLNSFKRKANDYLAENVVLRKRINNLKNALCVSIIGFGMLAVFLLIDMLDLYLK